jgi:serine/threonine-protein kinase
VGEWGQRTVVWASATTPVIATLAAPPADLDMPARLRAVAGAARGAHALHERGQLHAAICPQAIALTAPDQAGLTAGGSAVGGAVLSPPSLADGDQPLAQIGYPPLAYMDPQLLRGEGGRWSDIWALGATAHHALTGAAPFPGVEDLPVVQALAQLLTATAPARGEMPASVSSVIASCLAVDPADRPATAEEVAGHLEEAAANW